MGAYVRLLRTGGGLGQSFRVDFQGRLRAAGSELQWETSMTKTEGKLEVNAALRDPAATFAEPAEIVAHPDLSRSRKLRMLRQWEQEARVVAVAQEEGMTSGGDSMLGRIRRAIGALSPDGDDEIPPAPTKHAG